MSHLDTPSASRNDSPVRVFIGSGEASRLERKTLIHSIRKNTKRPLDIYVFNGTHNAIEHNDEPPILAPLPLHIKYQSVTEFSLYRYLIPQLCGYEGKAIHLDSDMICLGDIGELFDAPMNDHAILATRAYGANTWGTSVSLFDCAKCRFDLQEIFEAIERGEFSYSEFSQLHPKFLAKHPMSVGELDPNWNVFDRYDENTRLIHYTDLYRQPWKFPHHPAGELWFEYFDEARAAGAVSQEDVDLSIMRAYVRRDILQGNAPTAPAAPGLPDRIKRKIKSLVR
jgi:hypothetical protein